MKPSVKSITQMGFGCVVLVICSWCAIPFGVPITLQLLGFFLLLGLFGTKKTLGSLISYILLGILGIPVFAGFQGGIGVLIGPTGGYLVGLVPLTLFCGLLYPKAKSLLGKGLVFFFGLFVLYIAGTLWYVYGFSKGAVPWGTAFGICVAPFLLPDILKIIGSLWLLKRLDGKRYETMV